MGKLSDASSEAAKTIVRIGFAEEYGYLDKEMASELENRYRQAIGELAKMMSSRSVVRSFQ